MMELLEAREQRAARQQAMLDRHKLPLISFSMNIPGPVKRTPLIEFAFDEALLLLPQGQAVEQTVLREDTGCEAILCCDQPADLLKTFCQSMEEAAPVGRLYDLDVLTPEGEKLSRGVMRPCLICGGPAFPCARSRAHSLEELDAAVTRLLEDFAATRLASLAVQALKAEVALTPKPGLVDMANSGAHTDMDLPLFVKSAEALRPYFEEAVRLGLAGADAAPLQQAGLRAEKTMFEATGGINTHKGAIYGFGLLLCAMGHRLKRGCDLFDKAAELAAGCKKAAEQTHGSIVLKKHGAGGARQEALSGFPTARYGAKILAETGDGHTAFLSLLLRCEDTNLLYRGGKEGLDFARDWASRVLNAPAELRPSLLKEMDEAFISRNLSPGGTADLLALSLFLHRTKNIWH